MRPSPVAILLCVISAASASASLGVRHISLERVVRMSQLIVVAESDPTPQRLKIKINDPKNSDQRYPDFEYTLSALKLTEVLHA